jgi:hypothetical protein
MSKRRIPLATVLTMLGPLAAGAENPAYLHLSDVHLDVSGASSDTDPQLWAITKAKLAAILGGAAPPAFVLYTGDLPGHYDCEDHPPDDPNPNCRLDPSQVPAHTTNAETVLQDLHDLVAGRAIPLLYVPGNNDSLAGDYFSFTDRAGRNLLTLVPDERYPAVHASRPCGRPPCTVSAPHPSLGFYSVRPVEGLRVIALNSIVLGRKYVEVDGTTQLAAGNAQLVWLTRELADAAGSEKVLIAMHIPPGNDAYAVSHGKTETWMWARHPDGEGDQPREHLEHWLDRFLDRVAAHPDTVVGVAYGHTHMDELRRLHDRTGAVTEVAISAPGITTNHGNNPGFKLVTYDGETKELLDFVTFYTRRGNAAWGDEHYLFSALFDCAGQSMLACLSSDRYADTPAVAQVMDGFFTVMNGPPSYATGSGIEVEHGQ